MSKLYNLPSTFLRNMEVCHSLLYGRSCYSFKHWHSVCQSGMQFLLHQMRFILCLIIKKDEYINFLMEPKNESRPMSLSTISQNCYYEIEQKNKEEI
jgi:hypothetical protein